MSTLEIHVVGVPAPQGSKRGFVVKGRVVMAESSKKVRPWRQDVKAAALEAITPEQGEAFPTQWEPLAGPLSVAVTFFLPRPGYHFRTGKRANELKPNAPDFVDKKPDVDKLLRSTFDALGEAGVWRDDAQVAKLSTSKLYTGSQPGALIVVTPLAAQVEGAA